MKGASRGTNPKATQHPGRAQADAPAQPHSGGRAVILSRLVMYLALALGGLGLDLATKHWAFSRLGMPGTGEPIWLWKDYLSLETHLNEGALFGIGQGRKLLFIPMAMLAVSFVAYWLFVRGAARDRLLTLALGIVTGGILGNMYDRLGLHRLQWNYPQQRIGEPVYAVRDWIHFQVQPVFDWPVFNVADSLLVCGAILLFWHSLRRPPDESAEPAET